ncbi:flagellar hook-basal body complex protein FliE [Candidatus Thiodiazotropha endoloripes]|uniref:flagellar hook-basal body complex protein FliE n=1 Tax=Candidatus Thiodiazotropha endoloripes TaxID=1818881 RepID=UPI00083E476D|nr:flagellar hook-basal body complex protein FliE [Candidatus Thiodiazotropha endoloripes]ODB85640.1 flagellar hook-basal body complex protein FliE [Candidatus Thiodiazotropha endoloripes]
MSIETLAIVEPGSNLAFTSELGLNKLNAGTDFSTWFENQISELNTQINNSENEVRKLATGETNNIHHVMLSLEKAKLSFDLLLQVRSKALDAYQDIMKMQL